MQYDIAKNGEGPLTRTVKQDSVPGPSSMTSETQQLSRSTSVSAGQSADKKRKFVEFAEALESVDDKQDKKSKGKQKDTGKDKPLPLDGVEPTEDEDFENRIVADTRSALTERLTNIEEHLAVRYGTFHLLIINLQIKAKRFLVPSIPRTFLARLKYLEDHLIHLEKEYPPWAALHFNQPSRGVRFHVHASFLLDLGSLFFFHCLVACSTTRNPHNSPTASALRVQIPKSVWRFQHRCSIDKHLGRSSRPFAERSDARHEW